MHAWKRLRCIMMMHIWAVWSVFPLHFVDSKGPGTSSCWQQRLIRLPMLYIYEPQHDKTNKISVHPVSSDQPGHLPSLIRVFAVRMKRPWVLSYPLSAQRRLWSDWADAEADLSLRWAHTHFVGFVMLWLICTCHFIGFAVPKNMKFCLSICIWYKYAHSIKTKNTQWQCITFTFIPNYGDKTWHKQLKKASLAQAVLQIFCSKGPLWVHCLSEKGNNSVNYSQNFKKSSQGPLWVHCLSEKGNNSVNYSQNFKKS